jgi:glutamyl-tRNA reductase
MCNVYNSIGCLTVIKAHLRQNNINDFNSLNEVVNFQKNYLTYRQEIVSSHEKIIEQEKTSISADILQLESSIHSDKVRFENLLNMEIEALEQKLNNFKDSTTPKFLQKFFNRIRQWYYQKKIDSLRSALVPE